MKLCKACKKPVPQKKSGTPGIQSSYCSKKCRMANLWLKKSLANRKKYFCNVCGNEIPYKYKPGRQKLTCDDICEKIWFGYMRGNIGTLMPMGSMVLENDEKEQDRLYAMTLEEMSKELNISIELVRREVSKALFKFWAIFNELYGRPDFEEPNNDCWDQLYNYIICEQDYLEDAIENLL